MAKKKKKKRRRGVLLKLSKQRLAHLQARLAGLRFNAKRSTRERLENQVKRQEGVLKQERINLTSIIGKYGNRETLRIDDIEKYVLERGLRMLTDKYKNRVVQLKKMRSNQYIKNKKGIEHGKLVRKHENQTLDSGRAKKRKRRCGICRDFKGIEEYGHSTGSKCPYYEEFQQFKASAGSSWRRRLTDETITVLTPTAPEPTTTTTTDRTILVE